MYGCNRSNDGGYISWVKSRLIPRIFDCKSSIFSF